MTNPPEPPPYPGEPGREEPIQPPSYPPPPPQQPGGLPPQYGAVPPPPPGSSKATTALILGILGIICCAPLGIVAIVIGKQSTREAAVVGAPASGTAKAAIILGWIAVALMAIGIVFWGLFFALGLSGALDTTTY